MSIEDMNQELSAGAVPALRARDLFSPLSLHGEDDIHALGEAVHLGRGPSSDPLEVTFEAASESVEFLQRNASPILVSFYGGAQYYYRAADRLRQDCARVGLDCDIVEYTSDDIQGRDWPAITRMKPEFLSKMMSKHDRPLIWCDVDTRVLAYPEMLRSCHLDFMGFARRLLYIRDRHERAQRYWSPFVYVVGNTPKGKTFLDLMLEIEGKAPRNVTDDYVLEEAWLRHHKWMNVGMLSPDAIVTKKRFVNDETVFLHGSSGNVESFIGTVLQHGEPNPKQIEAAQELGKKAEQAQKSGDRMGASIFFEAAAAIAPMSEELLAKRVRILKAMGRAVEALELVSEFEDANAPVLSIFRLKYNLALEVQAFNAAKAVVAKMLECGDTNIRSQGMEYEADLLREMTAHDLGLGEHDRVRMYWMKQPLPGNFGDVLNPYLVERLTGVPPIHDASATGLVGVGSVIKFAKDNAAVWGSGASRSPELLNPQAKYFSVRGPLTLTSVRTSGGQCPEVFGDGALLLPEVYTPNRASMAERVGFIRHVTQTDKGLAPDGVHEIELGVIGNRGIEGVIDQIASCELIMSTSLHGVIVAHAYGVPAVWCSNGPSDTSIAGDGSKFADYLMSQGMPVPEPFDISALTEVNERTIASMEVLVPSAVDRDPIRDAFYQAYYWALESSAKTRITI